MPEPAPPRLRDRVLAQLRDPMILLLLAAAALTVALRDLTDLTVILLVVVLNTAVGVLQEVRAERALAALRRLAAPTARLRRDGRVVERAADEVVPGDLLLLEAGDIVAADGRVVEAATLEVDESALTGESVPVQKIPAGSADLGADVREDEVEVVNAGTVVTRGRGLVQVTATGPASALGRISSLLGDQRPRPTPLQRRIGELGRLLAIVASLLALVVTVSALARGRPLEEVALTAVSLAVAAVPESLPAVVTLALALGARRMARSSAVVRQLPAVETLGSVTVLASDKTGTLTVGRMTAERIWLPGAEYVVGDLGEGQEVLRDRGTPEHRDALGQLLLSVALCNDAELRPPDRRHTDPWMRGDATEVALLALAGLGGVDVASARSRFSRASEIPFDSVRKRMTTVHTTAEGPSLVICKGAPEALFATPGLLRPGEAVEQAQAAATRLALEGFRVLAVASRSATVSEARDVEDDLRLLGLVGISDPPRPDAAAVVAAVGEAGVDLVLVTGDHPETARSVAERIGIESSIVVTGAELEAGASLHGTELPHVFARTRPEQKVDIVAALQAQGHVVAMTGDGVNDAPALRRADIGVAMGGNGTEVAKQAADLVLTDDDLRTVVTAIGEGRRVYGNIRTFLGYGLAGGLAEVLVMLLGPAVGLAVPLLPAQILWINLLTHGLPGVAFGAEPADPADLRRGPRSPQEAVLGAGLWRLILVLGVAISVVALLAGWYAARVDAPAQTVVFLVLGTAQLAVGLALRRRGGPGIPRVRFLDVAVAGAVLLQLAAIYVPGLAGLMQTEPLSLPVATTAVLAACLPGVALALTLRAGRADRRR